MTSPSTTIYTPFADGRTVHDIVEHSPALVNEAWCRNLLRRVLDSLEQQYASGAPHRRISPETLVMLNNGEALLLPAAEDGGEELAGAEPTLAGDLHALAQVVHYAITAELPPDGPVGPRLYDNYSDELTRGIDRCLGPNLRLRPKTVPEMRSLLGLEGGAFAGGEARAQDDSLPQLHGAGPVQSRIVLQPENAAMTGEHALDAAHGAGPMHANDTGLHAAPVEAHGIAGFAPVDTALPQAAVRATAAHAEASLLRQSATEAGPTAATVATPAPAKDRPALPPQHRPSDTRHGKAAASAASSAGP
ncbi:hypothetical protein G4G28_15875 [Massilia sp. Dwa41.01b]|uniref:hypothetical protein n=1 Tax=Massilia sp. Dwa41.01b TaxID=2709302 RepID=UPI00160474A4|nr:hypothetical protein [Massilia sp. Dwa41.01b]QNA89580.1 hypothetical protein G4G28_15875 [Massilia sp. Dwa41.01b]